MNIHRLEKDLHDLLQEMVHMEAAFEASIREVHPNYRLSAKNLLRYLLFRSRDIRKYHGLLSDLGLSSLRSAEGYVFSNLYNVVRNVNLVRGTKIKLRPNQVDLIGYTKSKLLLEHHSNDLFQDSHRGHFTRIMVTLPEESASDKEIIKGMIERGMRVARINLSHGDLTQWKQMVDHVHSASNELNIPVKIYMDLSGPKLRTCDLLEINENGKLKKHVRVKEGDLIRLVKESDYHEKSSSSQKTVGVQLDTVIEDAQLQDRVLFDDGMICSKVVEKHREYLVLDIKACHKPKIGSQKGINLPDTKLNLPSLTPRDLELLPFVVNHADIVGYSFVRNGSDVEMLYAQLDKLGGDEIGVVFKIENDEAFNHLPEILLKGMRRDRIGVMIARGDLAVEVGFERNAELQNEILWLCEAAHVPVIWATQILENLAKTGIPTRAEMTDTWQAAQAECAMLNKGPNINKAIEVLQNILDRMEGHASKKKNELRALEVAKEYYSKLTQAAQFNEP
jgi:pyruvate kinase